MNLLNDLICHIFRGLSLNLMEIHRKNRHTDRQTDRQTKKTISVYSPNLLVQLVKESNAISVSYSPDPTRRRARKAHCWMKRESCMVLVLLGLSLRWFILQLEVYKCLSLFWYSPLFIQKRVQWRNQSKSRKYLTILRLFDTCHRLVF